ncbi:MAG TPA: helix-turn-helix domain-containing protein, partial [Ramlibacter sp.]|nr:helix-turn-helix domain-containing protein [Ramlibacter sp.]
TGTASARRAPNGHDWEAALAAEALELLASGRHDVWDELTRRFESKLILTALANTRGRRIEAAQKLGIGRNTITRKIQELGLECLNSLPFRGRAGVGAAARPARASRMPPSASRTSASRTRARGRSFIT